MTCKVPSNLSMNVAFSLGRTILSEVKQKGTGTEFSWSIHRCIWSFILLISLLMPPRYSVSFWKESRSHSQLCSFKINTRRTGSQKRWSLRLRPFSPCTVHVHCPLIVACPSWLTLEILEINHTIFCRERVRMPLIWVVWRNFPLCWSSRVCGMVRQGEVGSALAR